MRFYYYPLSSYDFTFENIFSTESISPPDFYLRRGFGFDFFHKLPNQHHEKFLVLYNSPPKYELPKSNSSVVKFILQITEDSLDIDDSVTISEGVVGYPKTIYLNQNNFKLLFFSERDMKLVQMKSESSLPTKDLKKYEHNFALLSEEECVKFNTSRIPDLDLDSQVNNINFDRRFNFFKGFLYSVIIGRTMEGSIDEVRLVEYLREITNSFAELKNRNEHALRDSSKSRSGIAGFEKKLFFAIAETETLFLNQFPRQLPKVDAILDFLLTRFPNQFNSISDAKVYINHTVVNDQILGTNNLDRIRDFVSKNSEENITRCFDQMRHTVKLYLSTSGNQGKDLKVRENANDGFKDLVFRVKKFVETSHLQQTTKRAIIPFESIQFDVESNQILMDAEFLMIDPKLTQELCDILNVILQSPKPGKGSTSKEILLQIIERVSIALNKNGRSTQLYRYLNNEIDFYSIDNAASVVMKNFVVFILNPDSIEKLNAFNNAKQVAHPWISQIFWCTFNGFANTSRNYLKPIFATSNTELQSRIDSYLQVILRQRVKINTLQQSTPKSQDDFALRLNKVKSFFGELVGTKHKFTSDELIAISRITDKDEFSDILKNRFKIPKREGKKLFDSFIDFINSESLF